MCLLLPTSPCIKQSPYVCLSLPTSFCDRQTACVSICYTITLYQAISICQPLPLSVTSKHRVSVIPSLCIKQLYFLPLSVPGKQHGSVYYFQHQFVSANSILCRLIPISFFTQQTSHIGWLLPTDTHFLFKMCLFLVTYTD